LSKILKNKQINNTSIIIPDPSLIKKEEFQSLFEINIEDISKLKKGIKSSEEKAKKEGFEKGYKEGLNKGYLEGHKKGYKEGFEKGKKEAEERYKKLENILKKDFQEKIQSINTFLKNLEKESKELILNMDKEVLNLALNIAQKLILKEIERDPEISLRLIKEALNYIAEGTELNIKVKIKLIPDESISKGGIFIETFLGVIDATFEKRWKKLSETFLKDEG